MKLIPENLPLYQAEDKIVLIDGKIVKSWDGSSFVTVAGAKIPAKRGELIEVEIRKPAPKKK